MDGAVTHAREFALSAHGDQKYGERPYLFHLDAVAQLLGPLGEQAQVVGYLHDVVEDTGVSLETIRQEFGDEVARYVALVTDESGANRRERKARTNAKLAACGSGDSLALIVKAADRLANLRASAGEGPGSKLGMYRREHQEFRRAVYRAGLCDELWQEMDRILDRSRAEPLHLTGRAVTVTECDTVWRPAPQVNCGFRRARQIHD